MDGFMTTIKCNHNQNNQECTAVFTFFFPQKSYVFTRVNLPDEGSHPEVLFREY